MEKGEEPMKYFGRIYKIVGVLASLGVVKSATDVNRKIIMTLTSDYEIEERTILYREDVTRAEIESIIRQRYLRLPAPKGNGVGQALFLNGAARGGRAGRGRHRSSGKPRGGSDTASKNSQGSSSSNPQAPTRKPPQRSTTSRENAFVAWNSGTPGPSARLASPLHQSRHQAEVRKARTTAVRLCVVLRSACLLLTMTRVMRNVVIASVRSG